MGVIVAAEFGELRGIGVIDLITCQEYALKELNFHPGRESSVGIDDTLTSMDPTEIFASVALQVTKCAARPFIYGASNVRSAADQEPVALLEYISEFQKYRELLQRNEPSPLDRQAPLVQCTLIRRALDRKSVNYQHPMVPLKTIRALVDFVKPLDEWEEAHLAGYMKSLLPHIQASHMPLERFYAFASALESIADRRGAQRGDGIRKLLLQIFQGRRDGDKGSGSAPVPNCGGGPDKRSFTETTPKPQDQEDDQIEEEDPFF